MIPRVGVGVDAHRLVVGRRLVLGGVTIPFDRGLDGHSDADVVSHAVVDALLGALGLGNIGIHFPNTDPRWKNVDSSVFLSHARDLLAERGYRIGNVDLTVVAEAPRLAPYVEEMRAQIADTLGVETETISIKATTAEGMGALGRGEGISCFAVALVVPGEAP